MATLRVGGGAKILKKIATWFVYGQHRTSHLIIFTATSTILYVFMFSFSGIHAREWISPATAAFLMRRLVENNHANQDLIDFFDFYILPVANPDG